MQAWCLVVVCSMGCAQLAGIDETSARDASIDATADAPRDSSLDAAVCAGGDARVTDPMSGACYTFFMAPQTRNDARATCSGLGGGTALATVQSAAENQLLATLVGASIAYVGGNDEITEGMFTWDDGSAVVLSNWNTGEPNNGAGSYEEDCIVINGALAGKWDDRPCAPGVGIEGAYPFVCERD